MECSDIEIELSKPCSICVSYSVSMDWWCTGCGGSGCIATWLEDLPRGEMHYTRFAKTDRSSNTYSEIPPYKMEKLWSVCWVGGDCPYDTWDRP